MKEIMRQSLFCFCSYFVTALAGHAGQTGNAKHYIAVFGDHKPVVCTIVWSDKEDKIHPLGLTSGKTGKIEVPDAALDGNTIQIRPYGIERYRYYYAEKLCAEAVDKDVSLEEISQPLATQLSKLLKNSETVLDEAAGLQLASQLVPSKYQHAYYLSSVQDFASAIGEMKPFVFDSKKQSLIESPQFTAHVSALQERMGLPRNGRVDPETLAIAARMYKANGTEAFQDPQMIAAVPELNTEVVNSTLSNSVSWPKYMAEGDDPVIRRAYEKGNLEIIRQSGQKEGHPFVLVPVLFRNGTAEFADSGSLANLKKIAEVLEKFGAQDAEFGIEIHTGASGDPKRDTDLSDLRAKKVEEILQKSKIPETLITSVRGLGSRYAQFPASAAETTREQDDRVVVVRER